MGAVSQSQALPVIGLHLKKFTTYHLLLSILSDRILSAINKGADRLKRFEELLNNIKDAIILNTPNLLSAILIAVVGILITALIV